MPCFCSAGDGSQFVLAEQAPYQLDDSLNIGKMVLYRSERQVTLGDSHFTKEKKFLLFLVFFQDKNWLAQQDFNLLLLLIERNRSHSLRHSGKF